MQDYNNDRNTFNKRRISKSMKSSLDVVRRIFRSNSDSDPRHAGAMVITRPRNKLDGIEFHASSIKVAWKPRGKSLIRSRE